MEKVWVIAPDKPSGDAFDAALKKRGVDTCIYYAYIEPRVLGDSMNRDPKVEHDLAQAIEHGYERGFRTAVIACNTLQLWIDKAKKLLPETVRKEIRVVTTFEAVESIFPQSSNRPIWLGTTVTARAMLGGKFRTLLGLGFDEAQDLVQEIIWRTKAVTGADVTTATSNMKDLSNPLMLSESVLQLIKFLKEAGLTRVILGCTELPIALGKFTKAKERTGLKLVDPAKAVARMVVD